MMKRLFFVFVMFGVILAGAMVTMASPTDPVEVDAAAESDAPSPATFGDSTQAAIVNSEPRGCKYPDICPPPPPLCGGSVRLLPWELDQSPDMERDLEPRIDAKLAAKNDIFLVKQAIFLSHMGCGDGALSTLTSSILEPTADNPWVFIARGTCENRLGTWVFSSGVSGGNFEVVPTNGATNTPIPVVISMTSQDCADLLNPT